MCVCACLTGAILDPFAGAGTTLIEAMVAGRAALGCDISPLTVGIARAHCWLPTDAALDELRCAMVSIIAALQRHEEGATESAAEGAPPAAVDFSHARAVVSATLDAAGVSEGVVAAAAWFLLSHEEVYKWPDWRKVCVPLSPDASPYLGDPTHIWEASLRKRLPRHACCDGTIEMHAYADGSPSRYPCVDSRAPLLALLLAASAALLAAVSNNESLHDAAGGAEARRTSRYTGRADRARRRAGDPI